MKIGKKFFGISFLVLVVGLISVTLFRSNNPIKASNDDYKLELVKDDQPNQWILKLNIAETKDENLRLEYTGVDGIASETVLEGLVDDKTSDSIEIGKESIEKGYINFKTKKGYKNFTNNMLVSLLEAEKAEKGKVSLYSGDTLLAETTFDLPVEELPTEIVDSEDNAEETPDAAPLEPVAPVTFQAAALLDSGIMPFADPVTVVVNSWTELVAELTSGTSDVIELGQSIDASSAGPTITRNVTISGGPNKYSLNMLARYFTLGSVSTATTIAFDNIQLSSTGTTTPFLNATTANSNNWQVNFNNITLPTTNYKGLVSAVNSKVSFTGTNDLNINGGRTIVAANGISITGDLSFKAANASGTIQSADFFVNGQANPTISVSNSNLTIQTNGSIFNSTGGSSSVTIAQFIDSNIKSLHASTTNFLLETGKIELTIANTPIEAAGFGTNFIRGNAGITSSVTNSPITITGGMTSFMYAGNAHNVSIMNSPINITGAVTNLIYSSSAMVANLESSEINVTGNVSNFIYSGGTLTTELLNNQSKVVGNVTNFIYSTSALSAKLLNSPSKVEGNVGYFMNASGNLDSTMTDSTLEVTGTVSSGIMSSGSLLTASHVNSPVTLNILRADGYTNNLAGGKLSFDNSPVTVVNMSSGNYFMSLARQGDVTFQNGSNVEFISTNGTNGNFFNAVNNATGSSLLLTDITMNVDSGSGTAVNVGSGDGNGSPNFNLTMSNTKANFVSTSAQIGNTSGVISLTGTGSNFYIEKQSELNVYSNNTNATPAVMIMAAGGGFYIKGQSKIHLESQGEPTYLVGTLRFRIKGDMTFDLDEQSSMEVRKNSGASMAVRMYGENNKFFVKGASDVIIANKATPSGSGDGGENGAQGIYFTGSSGSLPNTFEIQGEDSNVSITAENGPAIEGDTRYPISITAADGSYFVARGKTKAEASGIFMGGKVDVSFGTMKYFDFTNTRTNGGAVFSSSSGTFTSNNTNLSLWRRANGVNVNGNPTKSFIEVAYNLSGANFNTFTSGTAELQTYLNGEGGLGNFTRMNGNNQQAIIDELRVPTNSDKYVWGHASVPEGKGELDRDAYTGEVSVTVDILDSNDNVVYTGLTGTIVENVTDSGTVSVYGEAERAGIFKIEVPDNKFLKTGYKVKVTDAWRGDPNSSLAHSTGDQIQTGTVITIDVTPPTQAVSSVDVSNATKQLTGTSDEEGAKVFVKVNDQWLKDSNGNLITTTVSVGNWLINLPAYVTKTDNVDIYLKDNTTISPEPSYTLPTSYTQEPDGVYGNLNEDPSTYSAYTGYHDAVDNTSTGGTDDRFDQALRKVVKDVLPDLPSVTKSAESSGGTTTSVGDTVTYTLTATNTKTGVEDWKNVKFVDVLPEHLTFDENNHGIKIQGTPITDTSKFDYDPATRTLTIYVGDIAATQSISASFNVTVDASGVGKDILNFAEAIGYSPQEDPFVPGPIDPTTTHKEITGKSDSIGLPGGVPYGTLNLLTAPESIDFGTRIENAYGTTRYENPDIKGSPLVVSDTRGNAGKWELYVTLTSPFANADSSLILPEALKYNTGSTEFTLTSSAQEILYQTNAAGVYNVTEKEWDAKGTGFVFELPAGGLKSKEKYTANILFTLSDTK